MSGRSVLTWTLTPTQIPPGRGSAWCLAASPRHPAIVRTVAARAWRVILFPLRYWRMSASDRMGVYPGREGAECWKTLSASPEYYDRRGYDITSRIGGRDSAIQGTVRPV